MRSIVIKFLFILILAIPSFGQILGHANGGTDVASPGTSGNVLCSAAGNWASCTPGTPVNGSTALFDDFCNNSSASTLNWTANGGGGGVTTLVGGVVTNHPCQIEIAGTSQGQWEYLILGTSNTGKEWFAVNSYTASLISSVSNNLGATNTIVRFGLFANRGTQDSDGVFFEASSALNGNGNWWCVTRTASVRTTQDSGVSAPTGGIYHNLEFDFNSTATPVWKIDGVAVCGTLGAVNTASLTPAYEAADVAATGAQTKLWVDYFQLMWTGLVR